MGLFTFIFGILGCNKQTAPLENEVKFSKYSQQARKDYINEYLQENYNLNCKISEVKQKQVTALKNEDYYFATATTATGDIISVWVSNTGEIKDSFSLIKMSDEISAIFSNKVHQIIPGCEVYSYTEFRDFPTSDLISSSNVELYLQQQPTYTYVRIFTDEEVYISEATMDSLQSAMGDFDSSIYLYKCDNLTNFDYKSYDLSSYELSRTVEKGN